VIAEPDLLYNVRFGVRLAPKDGVRLGPSLKDHVERPRRRPSNLRKPAVANDFS
jgi:hypothetical protein